MTLPAAFQVLELRHGVMMVGPSGSGKTSAWRCLLSALEMLDGVKGEAHVIDPKAIGETAVVACWTACLHNRPFCAVIGGTAAALGVVAALVHL